MAFLLGALWYSPVLFARPWMAAHGFTEEQIKKFRTGGAAPAYATSFVCWLSMATVLALVAPHFGEGVLATLHMALLLLALVFCDHKSSHRIVFLENH